MDFYRLVTAIRQRKLLFVLCFALALGAAILIPRGNVEIVYTSSGKVLLTPPSGADIGGNMGNIGRWWFTDEATLRELCTSEGLLTKVISKLKLKTDWATLKKDVTLGQASTDSGMRAGSSSLFQISATAATPGLARDLATAVMEEFVAYVEELSAREFANTRKFLEGLVLEARGKVEDTENKLFTIVAARELSDDDRQIALAQSDLESQRSKLREQLAQAEAENEAVAAYLNGGSSVAPWSVLKEEGAMIRPLEQAVSASRLELINLAAIYQPDTDIMREEVAKLGRVQGLYTSKLREASSALAREKSAEITNYRNRLNQIDTQLLQLRTRMLSLKEKREVARLERQLTTWDENRLALIRQLYQARVLEQSSRRHGAISILERPGPGRLPRDKRLPTLGRSLAVGIPFALVFSVSMIALVEYTSSSLRLLPRIEESLDLPVLAVIPVLPADLATRWERIKTKADQEDR